MVKQQTAVFFILVSIVYFFFNSLFLPEGLLYTTLLTPVFFVYLCYTKGLRVYFYFLLVTLVFVFLQYNVVGHWYYYFRSFLLFQCTAVFALSAYFYMRQNAPLKRVFKILAAVNLLLLLPALALLFIPALQSSVWYLLPVSPGIPAFPRLKLFTYEASYYALILFPLLAYYLLRKLLLNGKTGILLLSLLASLLLSCSFGVIGGIIISVLLLFMLNLKELGKKINLNYLMAGILVVFIGTALLYFLYPHNFIFERLHNIATGKDTSARGRTTEAFTLAWDITKMKSILWGIGLGQLKITGRDYIIQFYHYVHIPDTIRIPNAVAETLNIYGLAGIALRFFLIIFLFFRTKVWENYYRLLLFLFIFIYQFTGSFIFNIAEYIIWALAFSHRIFPEFNRDNFVEKEILGQE